MPQDPAAVPPPGGAPDLGGTWPTPRPDDTPFDPFGPSTPLPRPINWDQVDADDLQTAWHELDDWVNWLRRTYALPASVIPPAWHRHPELHWELSALHLHWQSAYHPDQHASAPLGWHRDLTDAVQRLRDWTAASGTRLDHDRPTRHTPWPGDPELILDPAGRPLCNRHADFVLHVTDEVGRRRASQLGKARNSDSGDVTLGALGPLHQSFGSGRSGGGGDVR